MITAEQLVAALPANHKKSVSAAVMVRVGEVLNDPDTAMAMRDNILSFTSVMRDGRYKMEDYLNAVKYVSHKMMMCTNGQAWMKTFPERHARLLVNGSTPKDISAHVSMYNGGKLVNEVYAQSLIPTHVLNADVFQQAINTQAAIMADESVSHKVRSDAANSLLTHLKRPEAQKIELDIGVKQDSLLQELRDTTARLARQQQELIGAGTFTAKDIALQRVLTVEKNEDGSYGNS